MYSIFTANSKTEKILQEYISLRNDIKEKLDKLKLEPRRANGAHQCDDWGEISLTKNPKNPEKLTLIW